MTNFALIKNGIVQNIIVADNNFIASLPNSNEYVEYTNAGIGWSYDGVNFIPPKPDNATGFDADKCQWIVPEVKIETLA